MTPPPDRTGPADPGTAPLPRIPAGLVEPSAERPPPPPPVSAPPPPAPATPPPVSASPAAAPVAPAPPGTGATASGRAGRNLRSAITVGLSLGVVIIASLLIWRPAFLLVLTAAVVIGVIELSQALRAGRFRPPLIPLIVGSVAMQGLAWSRGSTGLVVGFFVTALAVVLWRLADGPAGYLRDASSGVLVALYVPLLAGFAALLLVPDDGATRVLTFMATVVASDVGGYAAGVLFGKHPMAPSISPKKSWEGLGGSVLACMLVATPLIALGLHGPWWGGALFGAASAVSATVGDLAESLIKRDLGIKDMGDLLPGHGGLMDRLDSLLPTAVVAYLLLSALAPA